MRSVNWYYSRLFTISSLANGSSWKHMITWTRKTMKWNLLSPNLLRVLNPFTSLRKWQKLGLQMTWVAEIGAQYRDCRHPRPNSTTYKNVVGVINRGKRKGWNSNPMGFEFKQFLLPQSIPVNSNPRLTKTQSDTLSVKRRLVQKFCIIVCGFMASLPTKLSLQWLTRHTIVWRKGFTSKEGTPYPSMEGMFTGADQWAVPEYMAGRSPYMPFSAIPQ